MHNFDVRELVSFSHRLMFLAVIAALACPLQSPAQNLQSSASEPWNKTEVLMPEDLAHQLASPHGKKPAIVCAGFQMLYDGAHIPGAHFAGPGRDPRAIEALKSWAKSVPKDRDIIVYCGCCPMNVCPNLRPAFEALRAMRPGHVKILHLEDSLAKDWVEKGYPVEKGGEQK